MFSIRLMWSFQSLPGLKRKGTTRNTSIQNPARQFETAAIMITLESSLLSVQLKKYLLWIGLSNKTRIANGYHQEFPLKIIRINVFVATQ